MKENLPDLMADTPHIKVAATKTGIFLKKAGALIGGALRGILIDIASETAKKTMFPGLREQVKETFSWQSTRGLPSKTPAVF